MLHNKNVAIPVLCKWKQLLRSQELLPKRIFGGDVHLPKKYRLCLGAGAKLVGMKIQFTGAISDDRKE